MTCRIILLTLVLVAASSLTARGDDLGPGTLASLPRLKSIYSEEHSLREFLDNHTKALVLVFMGTDCPVVRQYAPRLNELHERFRPEGVQFLGIYANAGDHVMSMAEHAQQVDLSFPVMLDLEHRLADQLNIEVMSEVVVLDAALRPLYQGAIDDQYKKRGQRASATDRYLEDALTAVVDGRVISNSFMPASGCRIERNSPLKPDEKLTYHKDVAPLVQKHCQSCHRPGKVGPFELMTYDDVCNHSDTIEEVVIDRRMPPWHGVLNKTFGALHNDKRLSDREIRTLVGWLRGGMAEGNPADAPPAATWLSPTSWAMGKPDFVYQMDKPFRVPATGVVNYQFFRVPMNLPEDRWIQAIEVRPGNREVVHHIGLHLVPTGTEDYSGLAMAALFGLTGDRAQPLNDYVPGDLCNYKEYPSDRAVRIAKGSDLIFEVHYTPTGRATVDRSEVAIRWASRKPANEVLTKVFRKRRGGFEIPPRHPLYRMQDTYYFEQDVLIDSIRPHMHARGNSFLLERVERDPQSDEVIQRETILAVPVFDLNWQRTYELDTPLWLAAGTELEATVTFDNSKFNPNNPDPDRTVYWGLQTTDEMLSTRFQYRLAK